MKKVAAIQTTRRKFFHQYLVVTQPLHGLKNVEISLLAELLYYRNELKREVQNERLLGKLLFSYETKAKISKALDMKANYMTKVMGGLKKKGVIENNIINKAYVITLTDGEELFTLSYTFKISNNGRKKKDSKEIS